MPEVPKIVHERLRVGAPGDSHPDANLLAAFAEQVLPAAERESVLQHLAQCGACRETLALSIPALETAVEVVPETAGSAGRVSAERRRTWFTWNRLGWAGLAAGVVIAVGVLVVQPGTQKSVNEAQQKPPVTAAALARKADAEKVTPLPPSSEIATTAENRPQAVAPPMAARRDEFKKLSKAAVVPSERPGPPLSAQQTGANLGHISAMESLKESAGSKDVQSEQAYSVAAPRPGATTESVEVTAGAPATESAQVADTLAENKATPVVRAKAARALDAPTPPAKTTTADVKQEGVPVSNEQDLAVNARNMTVLRQATPELARAARVLPQWEIYGDTVRRSFDSGAHWTTVFQPHRRLLCVAAAGTDVWTGGKEGDLFHSADSGATWNQVHPSIDGQTLADDVTHIVVHSSTQVVVSTSKNEFWITADGGKTWAKK
jgi:hypothetical protein